VRQSDERHSQGDRPAPPRAGARAHRPRQFGIAQITDHSEIDMITGRRLSKWRGASRIMCNCIGSGRRRRSDPRAACGNRCPADDDGLRLDDPRLVSSRGARRRERPSRARRRRRSARPGRPPVGGSPRDSTRISPAVKRAENDSERSPSVTPMSPPRRGALGAHVGGEKLLEHRARSAVWRSRAARVGPRESRASATSARRRAIVARAAALAACCPVIVTKPKFRIDAPLASSSRSTTTTRFPRRPAANA